MKKDNSFLMAILAAVTLAVIVILIAETSEYRKDAYSSPDYVDVQLVDINAEARSGVPMEAVKGIVIHYVGDSGVTAQQYRDRVNTGDMRTSSHFVIGLEGEIIQCLPLNEKASDSNERNTDTISIEVCHPHESGEFTEESYAALVKLTAWLCEKFGLTEKNLLRHYDITGMECPLIFVENEEAWTEFKSRVRENIE